MIGSTGAKELIRKIYLEAEIRDSQKVRDLKRRCDNLTRELEKKTRHYEQTIEVARTAMAQCDHCQNIIHIDEYDDLNVCTSCNKRDICQEWCYNPETPYMIKITQCDCCDQHFCFDCIGAGSSCYECEAKLDLGFRI